MVEAASVHWKTIGEHLCSTEKDSICFKTMLERWLRRSPSFHCQLPYLEDLIGILQMLGMKDITSKLEKNSSLMLKKNERYETDV